MMTMQNEDNANGKQVGYNTCESDRNFNEMAFKGGKTMG